MSNGERRQIFEHTDADGDKLDVGEWVRPDGTARLILEVVAVRPDDMYPEVGFDRADVLRLRGALDTWLHLHSPSAPAVAVAGEDIWGTRTPCIRCGHAEGVHTLMHGCGAVVDGVECKCGQCTCTTCRGAR